MLPIVTIPHPALRKISKEIPEKDLMSPATKRLLQDLSLTLSSRADGVGLSAPQLAINKRAFVVSGKIWKKDGDKKTPPDEYFLNPVITKVSKKLVVVEEGCLSIPNIYGLVKRPANVTIEYFDENGLKKKRGAGGLLARIFQHEIDHLNGTLFIDKATDIKEILQNKTNEKF